jgi:protein-disulfide isomerase
MTGRLSGLAILGLAILGSPASAKAAASVSHHADWTQTFAETPDGGFKMGNPEAKIEIVEYGSLTCPHCRHFAQTGMKPLLARYVRTGKASYEYRSLILNGVDVAATLVARCGGANRFFPMADELYATQPTWLGKVTDTQSERLNTLPENEQRVGVAKVTGLLPIAAKHGIPPAKAEQCLKSDAAVTELNQMAQKASEAGVQGTPTFFVNGKLVDAADWQTLEPFLKDAGS